MATAVNEHTGAIIKSGSSNHEAYSKNFDLIDSGVVIEDKTVTLVPVTIRIPSQLHRDLTTLGIACNKSVERICQEILLEACFTE